MGTPMPSVTPTAPSVIFNPYTQMDPNFIDYSSLYYNPGQLSSLSNVNQITAYSNALVSGDSPAYINSPTLVGNRYFLDTYNQCQDSSGTIHDRSILIDNVLASSISNPTNQGNQGLLYSILASLENINGSSFFQNATMPPPGPGSVPSSAPGTSSGPPPLPLCIPISVYIDGTNTTATKTAWVIPSDMANIDTTAIAPNVTESFIPMPNLLPNISTMVSTNTFPSTSDIVKQSNSNNAIMRANMINQIQSIYDSSYSLANVSIMQLFVIFNNYPSQTMTNIKSTYYAGLPARTQNKTQSYLTDASAISFIENVIDCSNIQCMNEYIIANQTPPQQYINDGMIPIPNPAYTSFMAELADLEIYRPLIIQQMLIIDYPQYFGPSSGPAPAPATSPTVTKMSEGFAPYVQYSINNSPAKYNICDFTAQFYIGSLTIIGIYILYRLFRKR